MRSTRGFVIVGFVVFLPLLTAVMSLVYGGGVMFSLHDRALNNCRKSMLNESAHVRNRWMDVERLNPKARLLRVQRESAEKVYRLAKMTANPKVIAPARLHLAEVQARQLVLQTQQKRLISLMRVQARSGEQKIENQFRELELWLHSATRPNLKVTYTTHPLTSPTPDYILQPPHHAFRWRVNLENIFPDSIRNALLPPLRWDAQCSVHWRKMEDQWEVRLNAGRPSWS